MIKMYVLNDNAHVYILFIVSLYFQKLFAYINYERGGNDLNERALTCRED